jgi:hypothetical protein
VAAPLALPSDRVSSAHLIQAFVSPDVPTALGLFVGSQIRIVSNDGCVSAAKRDLKTIKRMHFLMNSGLTIGHVRRRNTFVSCGVATRATRWVCEKYRPKRSPKHFGQN